MLFCFYLLVLGLIRSVKMD